MNQLSSVPDSSASHAPTISVVAISKNEEREMPSFLAHLLPWVDEIIIVDDESTDNTVAIARATGPKVRVIEQPMNPEYGFAGQRNRGIEEATSDWLLHMDMDERVPPKMAAEIQQAISDPAKDAYFYRRLNFFLHRPIKGGGWNQWNSVHLARRGMHRFQNPIHEQCIVQIPSTRIGQLEQRMWHLNDENYRERMRKSFQYCQIEAEKLMQRRKVHWYHLILVPLWVFAKVYIAKLGFRDGTPGLIIALHGACANFRTYALIWDEQHRLPRPDVVMTTARTSDSPAINEPSHMSNQT
jgi:glycosyltransferase involved in cell wall biosynthesis